MAQPGGNPRAGNIWTMRNFLTPRRVDPFGHKRTRAQPGRISAEGAQIAQPGEAVRKRSEQGGIGTITPGSWLKHAHATAEFQLSPQQPCATAWVARPRIAHRQRRSVRHASHPQARQPRHRAARIAQPAPRVRRAHPVDPSPRNAAMAAA
jgi:hypothetical protein